MLANVAGPGQLYSIELWSQVVRLVVGRATRGMPLNVNPTNCCRGRLTGLGSANQAAHQGLRAINFAVNNLGGRLFNLAGRFSACNKAI